MSLSAHLQREILKHKSAFRPSELKAVVLEAGEQWYCEHPGESDQIRNNLHAFGFEANSDLVASVQHHVLLHYYEKMLPLFCPADVYADYLAQRVDDTEAMVRVQRAREAGRACLIAISHFGAVELIAPTLARQSMPVATVLRFTTPELSQAAHERSLEFERSGRFGPVRFIEVGKPGVAAALEMAAVVRRRDILVSVFDERTEYSVPVKLRGRTIWGGAGLDRLLRFSGGPASLLAAFMVRTGEECYRLEMREVDTSAPSPVQPLCDHLDSLLREHVVQWYFLHENIPFVDENEDRSCSST